MPENRADLHRIASALDSGATGFTICQVADGVALAGSAFDGVAAYHVMSGSMHLRLSCGARHVVPPDSVALIPAGQTAEISTGAPVDMPIVDGKRSVTRSGAWLVADATHGRPVRLTVAAARIAGTSRVSLSQITIVRLSRDRVGRKLSRMLRGEIANPGTANGALAIAMMTACIVIALRKAIDRATPDTAQPDTGHAPIDRAVAAVRADPADAHSGDTLAAAAGMSRATFFRQFSRAMRMSPMQFVLLTRLNEAAALLRTSVLPVKEVAARTGFASRSHFSRTFRAAFGRDPSAFRDGSSADPPVD